MKSRRKIYSLIAAATFILTIVGAVNGETFVGGELAEDTTWSDSVVLDETVTVPTDIVLNIKPGTTVSMRDSVSLIVYGRLIADGNEAEPIRFTRYEPGTTWKQIMFIEAADSRFNHCIFEYADSEGAHQDYYEPGPRNYHEAIVALASHIDFDGCTFQNLPDESSHAEGDAMAIISDDPNHPGEASANIRNCQFLSIGQGIHTRFSYILVEDCFFTGKRGDNDDVDLWGESTPQPLIKNNLFLNPQHDDMINPTRCSAVITGNVIMGSDDHGVVLRDKGFPVVMNNLIVDCRNGGIAIENSCDALLVNNTIVDCGRGLRLFDLGRWGPPYRLNPGGGNATVINCIIWDCSQPVTLADSSSTEIEDTGSHITISYSDIAGGPDGVIISGNNSTLTWGQGNIDIDPQFIDSANNNFHLSPCSPCINQGDPNYIGEPNETDLDSNPRVIGGRIDMGVYEYPFIYDKKDEGSIQGSWWKYSNNPVFSAGEPLQWDNCLVGIVTVLKDDAEPVNRYKMWYVGGETQFCEGAGIGYATSYDGINWVRSKNNPVLEPIESWSVQGFSGICVIKDGSIYKLWYEGIDSQSTSHIGYATSLDGINWDINNSNPVFSPGGNDAWDNEDVGNPCIIKEDSIYKMWYWGDDVTTGIDQIGLAISNNGINWQRVGSEPVIAPDPDIWWQGGEETGTPHVLRLNSGYVMAYHAADRSGTPRIGFATSVDGLQWNKELNPVLDIGSDNDWDSVGVITGSLILEESHLKLWYLGIDASENIQVGLAISCDDVIVDTGADN
jgi:predicted GH43/DUF377 family glycosyl hydrolase